MLMTTKNNYWKKFIIISTFPDFDSWGNGSQDQHRQNLIIRGLETLFSPLCLCASVYHPSQITRKWLTVMAYGAVVVCGPSILWSLRDFTGNGWGQLRTTYSIVNIACLWDGRGRWEPCGLDDCVATMKRI